MKHADRPLLGIFLMLCFCLLAPLGDATAKLLSDVLPVGQLLLVRFGLQALILIPIVTLTDRDWRMPPRVLWLVLWRTLLHIGGIGCMFIALRHLPLADAIAIAFVMPFIMLLLGHYILGEEVGMRRLMACVVGFLGTLLIIQPSFLAVGLPAILPVIVAVIFALFMLVTRQIAKEVDPITLQASSGVIASLLLLPALAIGTELGLEELSTNLPDPSTWGLLLLIGVIGTIGHLFMTWSLRYAPSTTLASIQYVEIPLAAVVGWMIFGEWPNLMATAGIVITMAAGLYVILRERAILQASPEAA
ncbi:DMT family transporter [Shimia marina]|uniref:Carboxylate/amino acid/amine transporter n=1 Tax=Shimia marina TaxID=321267 RepID=A0A0P1FE54_9RHOB|nr:DMT family transporter [Shimia marina]CUH53130.1 carboxylate/amino acid/amine transporter [Shimia marina]SFE42302.1 Threonine/homoserine efflux transporter RhtA [Shimia marina]